MDTPLLELTLVSVFDVRSVHFRRNVPSPYYFPVSQDGFTSQCSKTSFTAVPIPKKAVSGFPHKAAKPLLVATTRDPAPARDANSGALLIILLPTNNLPPK